MNANDMLRIRANAGDVMQNDFYEMDYSILLRIPPCCRKDWWVIPNAIGDAWRPSIRVIIDIQIEDKHFMHGKSKMDTKCLI